MTGADSDIHKTLDATAAVVLAAGLVPGVFAGEMGAVQRAVLAAGVCLFGVLFVTVEPPSVELPHSWAECTIARS